jgi:hypothetical protein
MAEAATPIIPESENWRWLPDEWTDEAQPLPRQKIADFIHRDSNGQWWLKPHVNDADHHDDSYHRQLGHGDLIAFAALETFLDFTLTVRAGGFETCSDFEPRANWFRLEGDDDENIFCDLEELVSAANDGIRLNTADHTVEQWWWSDTPYKFRFEIDSDGNGQFVPDEPEATP